MRMNKHWSGFLWVTALFIALLALWIRNGQDWRKWEGRGTAGEMELPVTPMTR